MTEHERDGPHPGCSAAVDRALGRYGWRLLPREELVRRVAACLAAGEVAEPWPATIRVYCRALHAACSGGEGAERQELAFAELHRYLYELSFREIADLEPDLRQEAVNEALLRVWQRLGSYRVPGAFLALAALELRNALRPWWSHPLPAAPIDDLEAELAAPDGSDPLARALDSELRGQVRSCFEEALRRHPRARHQLEAVWLKYMVGLDDQTISQYLGKPIASIHVLRSRGLSQLRAEPGWRSMAGQLGLS